jgi:AcrR family transcriptional regulator
MAKQGYHHGNLRQALIDATLKLIETQGPQGFTLSDAAKSAGVTPAAVYRHFAGREDLIAECARQGFEVFADLMEHAYNGGRPTALKAFEATGGPIWPLRANFPVTTWRCLKVAFHSTEAPIWRGLPIARKVFLRAQQNRFRSTSHWRAARQRRCSRPISGR